jgi:hypothetical protein
MMTEPVYGVLPTMPDDQERVTIFAQMILDGLGDVSVTKRILDVCTNVDRIFLLFGKIDLDKIDLDTTAIRMFGMLDKLEKDGCEKYIQGGDGSYNIARWTPLGSSSISDWYKTLTFSVMQAADVQTDRVLLWLNKFPRTHQTVCAEKHVLQLGDPHTICSAQNSLLQSCNNPKWTLISHDLVRNTIRVDEHSLNDARSVAQNQDANADELRNKLMVLVNRPFTICIGLGDNRYFFTKHRLADSGQVDEYVFVLATKVPVLFAYSVRNEFELLMFLRECTMCTDGNVFPFESITLIAPKYMIGESSDLTVRGVNTVSGGNEIRILIDTYLIPSQNLIATCHFLNQQHNLPIGVTGADTMLESLHHGIHCVYCCANKGVMQMWLTFMIHVFGLNSRRVFTTITGLIDDDPTRISNVRFPWQYDDTRKELVDFASSVYKRLGGMTKEERRQIYNRIGTRSLETVIETFLLTAGTVHLKQ